MPYTTQPPSPWLVWPKPAQNARIRLFCFPYAGGGASLYRAWGESLPAEIEVCAIQLPGRENRLSEPAFSRIRPLVAALAPAIRPWLDEPFAFFGYSLGALVSFELVRHLRREGHPLPLHLFVAARRAPHIPRQAVPMDELSDAEFMAELRRLKGTPEAILQQADLMQFLLPLLRADFTLDETYTCDDELPLPCPISAFGGVRDEDISRDDMEAWRSQTASAFRLRMVPGDHFFIHTAQSLLLQTICHDLAAHLPAY